VTRRLRQLRPGSEAGQGLIEMLIAMTVLAVAIGSTLTIFAGSLISMQHAGAEGTALTLADRQMETYESMPFDCIAPTFSAPAGCITYTGFPNPYSASQTTTSSDSPDHRLYTVTTSITAAGSVDQITLTVTQSGSSRTLAQETSDFSSAGTPAGD
jgi:type II secretory pathway pseudopilin PulG